MCCVYCKCFRKICQDNADHHWLQLQIGIIQLLCNTNNDVKGMYCITLSEGMLNVRILQMAVLYYTFMSFYIADLEN